MRDLDSCDDKANVLAEKAIKWYFEHQGSDLGAGCIYYLKEKSGGFMHYVQTAERKFTLSNKETHRCPWTLDLNSYKVTYLPTGFVSDVDEAMKWVPFKLLTI